ncbi:hypothetical protein GM418_10930 [Maribellus comscasis]|uniref:Uncharacterized protein n=1 Tax=Maribellus comscasis TaxID=2681766 RepID=A0A6I6K2L1_9BACT|nr:hypothetical protein [Maribellus comscasis]QGY44154.1 hypothetical protein GM418_10930 [Maribellus comscasis]
MEQEQKEKISEYGLKIDLHSGELELFDVKETPIGWSFGQYVSHRTGSQQEMELLRRNLIQNNLKTLLRHG